MNNSEYGRHYYKLEKLNLLFAFSALLLLISIALVMWFDYAREWKFWQRKYINIEIKKNSPQSSGHHYLRNLPIIDLFNPSLGIRQVVIDDIKIDRHFAKIPTIDRCTTCHISVDQKDYANEKQPLKTHPRLDLFISSDSPHPAETFGCTVCHKGRGQGTTFITSAHTPVDENQKRDWELRLNWKRLTSWQESMLPLPYTEASCLKCHMESLNKIETKRLQTGKNLIEKLNCTGCHIIPGIKSEYKMGPSLLKVSAKFTEENLLKNIIAPEFFNSQSKMPSFFSMQSKSKSQKERYLIEASAIRDYLYSLSLREVNSIPNFTDGNIARGELLYKKTGCMGCHSMDKYEPEKMQKKESSYGPDLARIGSKVKESWLFSWLKNPAGYSKKTLMPNFRLSDSEALDLSAFLMSNKEKAPDIWKPEKSESSETDSLIASENKTEVQQIGKKLIQDYGCHGCHEIKGFGKVQSAAPDLSKEGSKHTAYFDFSGFDKNIEKTRERWLLKKVMRPADFSINQGVKASQRLFMPTYELTENEGEAIVTYLMGLTSENIPSEKKVYFSKADSILESGRAVAEKYNCKGCHTIEKTGGDFQSTLLLRLLKSGLKKEDATLLIPPSLEGEGEKVKPQWLLNFLKEPYSLRPWLSVRMPDFSFSDAERVALVEYFNKLSEREFYLEMKKDKKNDEALVLSGEKIVNLLKCKACHPLESKSDKMEEETNISDLAPNLAMAGERLRSEWIIKWLKDPQLVKKGTRMPTYWIKVTRGGKSYYVVPPSLKKIMDGNGDDHINAVTAYLTSHP